MKLRDFQTFMNERFPLIPNLIIALGMCFSIKFLYQLSFDGVVFTLAIILVLFFIAELRFMDEVKDYDKDILAHPTRPLPRGLIKAEELERVIHLMLFVMVTSSGALFLLGNSLAGAAYFVATVWLYLMYKEFFVGKKLADFPLVYAITHQIVILPIVVFLVALLGGDALYSTKTLGLAMIVLGSFFSYEVGRKLDPKSHNALQTYLSVYGTNKTLFLIIILSTLPLVGMFYLEALNWGIIPYLLVLITCIRLKLNPSIFKQLEGLIALNLIYNMWFLVLRGLL